MDDLMKALKAAAEPTRFRILAALERAELSVSQMCQVLDQSQPRVSRHLKVLCEAGLIDRHAEGTAALYRPTQEGVGSELGQHLVGLVDASDPVLNRDRVRLDQVRAERAKQAADYFAAIASDWDEVRQLHVDESVIEAQLVDAVSKQEVESLLDIGSGTGRILEVFAPHISRGLGVDASRQMLTVARARLDTAKASHCEVREGNVYELDVEAGSFDVAVIHHVLHFLDDPSAAITEAAKALRPLGRLLIADFAPHELELLRQDHAHVRLGFADAEVTSWCRAAGLPEVATTQLVPSDIHNPKALTVTIWSAAKTADSHARNQHVSL